MADLSITLPDGAQKQVPAGTTVGEAFRRLFRASNSDLIGKTDEDLQPQEIAKKLRDNDLGVLADNRSAEILETMPGCLTFRFRRTAIVSGSSPGPQGSSPRRMTCHRQSPKRSALRRAWRLRLRATGVIR